MNYSINSYEYIYFKLNIKADANMYWNEKYFQVYITKQIN